MKREAWKVTVACALGAGIGTLISLEVAVYLWWIGLIIGGLVGYLAYRPIAVIKAILPAARTAARATLGKYHAVRRVFTRPDFWPRVLYTTLTFFFAGSWLVLGLMLLMLSLMISVRSFEDFRIWMWLSWFATWAVTSFGFGVLCSIDEQSACKTEDELLKFRIVCFALCPPIVMFYHLPRGIWWVIRHGMPRAVVAIARLGRDLARFMAHFVWNVFVRIHSEMRLLCLVDASIGVVIGFFAGSALIGALAGGLFGLVNYALVTERILKPRGYIPVTKE